MARTILGIVAGYAIFVVTALLFFGSAKKDPHADPTFFFVIVTAVYGAVTSFIAGLITQLISKTNNLKVNYILALIIAGFATFSFFKSAGNHWTQLLAIIIFAPASIAGGLFSKIRFGT